VDARGKIHRHAVEIVGGQHDAAAAGRRDEIVEVRAPLHIHVFGAEREPLGQDALALFFRPFEAAAFPRGAARQDDRTAPSLEGAGRVRVADRIHPQLDEIRISDRVAFLAQFGRRGGGHRDAELRLTCRSLQRAKNKKSPVSAWAEEALETRSRGGG
jgi:hypothetical protein